MSWLFQPLPRTPSVEQSSPGAPLVYHQRGIFSKAAALFFLAVLNQPSGVPAANAYSVDASPAAISVTATEADLVGPSRGILGTSYQPTFWKRHLNGVFYPNRGELSAEVALDHILEASPGALSIGADPSLLQAARLINSASGAISITSVNAAIQSQRLADATPGALTVGPTAANAETARIVNAATGALTITPLSALIPYGRALEADPASISVGGASADVKAQRVLSTAPGSIVVSGIDAEIRTPTNIADVAPANLTISGTSALEAQRRTDAAPGALAVTPYDSLPLSDRTLNASTKAVSITPFSADLAYSQFFSTPTGTSYQPRFWKRHSNGIIYCGSGSVTGEIPPPRIAAGSDFTPIVAWGNPFNAAAAAFVLDHHGLPPQPVGIYTLNASPIALHVNPINGGLQAQRLINANREQLVIAPPSSDIAAARFVNADFGSLIVSTISADIVLDRALQASPAVLVITGIDADIEYVARLAEYIVDALPGALVVNLNDSGFESQRSVKADPAGLVFHPADSLPYLDRILNAAPKAITLSGVNADLVYSNPHVPYGSSYRPRFWKRHWSGILYRGGGDLTADIPPPHVTFGSDFTPLIAWGNPFYSAARLFILDRPGVIGQTAGIFTLDASPSILTVSGKSAATQATRILNAAAKSVSVTGYNLGHDIGRLLSAGKASLIITGYPIPPRELFDRELDAAPASVIISATQADGLVARLLNAGTDTIIITGKNASVLAQRLVDSQPGAVLINATDAALLKTSILDGAPGKLKIICWPADLHWSEEAPGMLNLETMYRDTRRR